MILQAPNKAAAAVCVHSSGLPERRPAVAPVTKYVGAPEHAGSQAEALQLMFAPAPTSIRPIRSRSRSSVCQIQSKATLTTPR